MIALDKPICAIFLDIDGVLCHEPDESSEEYLLNKELLFPGLYTLSRLQDKIVCAKLLHQEAVDHLDLLIERISQVAEPIIILSSSWRISITTKQHKEEVFKDWNFSRYIRGITPNFGTLHRAWEICCWLTENKDIKKYVIFDDYPFSFQQDHFVQVDGEELLSLGDIEKAWSKLEYSPESSKAEL